MTESEVIYKIGRQIKKYRTECKLTQEKLALICEVDTSHMGKIERGEAAPNIVTVYRICNGLGIKMSELLDGI